MACGHCLAAVRSGMAECTPNLRASYDAAETTPRSWRCPPTTTALPFSEGSNSSSTETKKASMSTWKMGGVRAGGGAAARARGILAVADVRPEHVEHDEVGAVWQARTAVDSAFT